MPHLKLQKMTYQLNQMKGLNYLLHPYQSLHKRMRHQVHPNQKMHQI